MNPLDSENSKNNFENENETNKIPIPKGNYLIPNVLYFGPENCLKEFKITCWTCFEMASLVHFISIRNL